MHNIDYEQDFRQGYEASLIAAAKTDLGKQFSMTTRPHASISKKMALYVLSVIALVMMVVAMCFAFIGAWPVLIYAVLVLLGLSAGFQHTLKQSQNYEKIMIQDSTLQIKSRMLAQNKKVEMNPLWAKVVMECQSHGDCRYLALRSHGRETEVGRYLSTEGRFTLATELKRQLQKNR